MFKYGLNTHYKYPELGDLKYVLKPYLIRKYLSIRYNKVGKSENQQVRYGSRESRRPRFKGA